MYLSGSSKFHMPNKRPNSSNWIVNNKKFKREEIELKKKQKNKKKNKKPRK